MWVSTTLVFGSKWKSHTFSSSIVRVTTRPALRKRYSSNLNSCGWRSTRGGGRGPHLRRREIDAAGASLHRALEQVHLQIGDAQDRFQGAQRRATGESVDAGEQFREGERLHQIIVAAR